MRKSPQILISMLKVLEEKEDMLKTVFTITFFSILILSVIASVSYLIFLNIYSEHLFTVGKVTKPYSSSKDKGVYFEYCVDGVEYWNICTKPNCEGLEIGRRYIVKYWDMNHAWWAELYPEYPSSRDFCDSISPADTPPAGL